MNSFSYKTKIGRNETLILFLAVPLCLLSLIFGSDLALRWLDGQDLGRSEVRLLFGMCMFLLSLGIVFLTWCRDFFCNGRIVALSDIAISAPSRSYSFFHRRVLWSQIDGVSVGPFWADSTLDLWVNGRRPVRLVRTYFDSDQEFEVLNTLIEEKIAGLDQSGHSN